MELEDTRETTDAGAEVRSTRPKWIRNHLRTRSPKKLEHGDILLLHYALRCLCRKCGKLIKWDDPDSTGTATVDCCGLRYTYRPHSVMVLIEDAKPNLFPPARDSLFPDPNILMPPDSPA